MRMTARIRGRRPSPALVVSILALVMATAGTATAARVLVTSSKQIAKGSVNSGDVRDGSLRGRDVRDGSLELGDLDPAARASIGGAQTSALEVFRKEGPVDVPAGEERVIATIASLEPGVYAIFSKTVLTPGPGEEESLLGNEYGASGHCILRANEDRDETRALLTSPGYNAPGELSNQITATFGSPGTVKLSCDSPDRSWRATDTSIIALRVAKAPRESVDG
jgi:hypothetical protein